MGRLSAWVLPTAGYILAVGVTGITAKLALRTITWEQLVLWVPIAYIVFSAIFVIFKGSALPARCRRRLGRGHRFPASPALILFFYALTKGPASQVTPATSAYPVVT